MVFVCKSVPYRNTRIFGKVFHDLLAESAELYSVKHASKDSCCVSNIFLVTKLYVIFPKILRVCPFINGPNSKCTASTGRGFLKYQGYVLAFHEVAFDPCSFFIFEISGEIQKIFYLLGGVVL